MDSRFRSGNHLTGMQTTRCRQYHQINGGSTAGIGLEQGVVAAKDNGAEAAPGYSSAASRINVWACSNDELCIADRHQLGAIMMQSNCADVIGADAPATHQGEANAAIRDWGDGMKHQIAQACRGCSKQRIRDSGEQALLESSHNR